VVEVDIEAIVPNPHQPRHLIAEASLTSLAESIRLHGILQPLVVARSMEDGLYHLIAGERRWRAAKLAGLRDVPVVVKEAAASQFLELALIENIQRADLNPLEEAEAYHQLQQEFGLTQEEIARKVGRNRVSVTNSLRLLKLPDEAKRSLASGEISEGHARALLGLNDMSLVGPVLDEIRRRALSVRQTEELVRRLAAGEPVKRPHARVADAETREIEERFRHALGTKVNLFRSKKGGKVVIHFYSEEELQAIYDLIAR
jgi:ParB family chromosome partitioning protein